MYCWSDTLGHLSVEMRMRRPQPLLHSQSLLSHPQMRKRVHHGFEWDCQHSYPLSIHEWCALLALQVPWKIDCHPRLKMCHLKCCCDSVSCLFLYRWILASSFAREGMDVLGTGNCPPCSFGSNGIE